jgi:hypothetical protein
VGAHARFRGHFLTKSHRYSTTFVALRAVRRIWRLRADLDALNRDTHGANGIEPDVDTVTVINDWWPVHYGHRDDGERELAAAIAERQRSPRPVADGAQASCPAGGAR